MTNSHGACVRLGGFRWTAPFEWGGSKPPVVPGVSTIRVHVHRRTAVIASRGHGGGSQVSSSPIVRASPGSPTTSKP